MRLWTNQEVSLFLSVTLLASHLAGAISIRPAQTSLTRSVQDDVLFSVNVSSPHGVPTVQWNFMSAAVSRSIGAWQPGVYANITADYEDRVRAFSNGSIGLSNLRLQDAGYYVITVTEGAGSSKDAVFVLKVNEVIYEDLQYLSVSILVLGGAAGLLMLTMWLINKAYNGVKARCRRRRLPEADETELQPL